MAYVIVRVDDNETIKKVTGLFDTFDEAMDYALTTEVANYSRLVIAELNPKDD